MKLAILSIATLGMLCQSLYAQATPTYIYTDPQGTPVAEADASGNITATFDHKPYGQAASGVAPDGIGYTGHVEDPDTALVYMQARYYDPMVGRFISADPAGQKAGFNVYAYVGNNPVNSIDPDGQFKCNDKESCEAGMRLRSDFQKAKQRYKEGSRAYKSIASGLKALGTANDGGSIHVVAISDTQRTSLGWGAAEKEKRRLSRLILLHLANFRVH